MSVAGRAGHSYKTCFQFLGDAAKGSLKYDLDSRKFFSENAAEGAASGSKGKDHEKPKQSEDRYGKKRAEASPRERRPRRRSRTRH